MNIGYVLDRIIERLRTELDCSIWNHSSPSIFADLAISDGRNVFDETECRYQDAGILPRENKALDEFLSSFNIIETKGVSV